jgi:hypothetical protein
MLTKMFHCVGTTNVICIGAPTIHERILHSIPSISSILLDIDHRYVSHVIQILCDQKVVIFILILFSVTIL